MADNGARTEEQASSRISKIQRWLDLISLLLRRQAPITAEEILSGVPWYARKWIDGGTGARANARRRFELDKKELRALGIPIKSIPEAVRVDGVSRDGYRLSNRDFYLPALKLISPDQNDADGSGATHPGSVEIGREEAQLAVDGLRQIASMPGHLLGREARSCLRKLTFDLDRFAFPAAPVLVASPSTAVAEPETLRNLLEATRARRRVKFGYHGIGSDETTRRVVAPYALVFQGGRWYVVGHDATRAAFRTFRVSRIVDVERGKRSGADAEYEIPDGFDVRDYLGRAAWELGGGDEGLTAHATFDAGAALQAERQGLGELVEARDDGSAIRAFVVHDADAFVRWVLTFQGRAQVVEPPFLAEAVKETAAEVTRLHASTSARLPPQRRRPRRTRRSRE